MGCRHGKAPIRHNDVRGEGDQLRRVFAHRVGIATAPAIIDPDVLADGPIQLLKTLHKCR